MSTLKNDPAAIVKMNALFWWCDGQLTDGEWGAAAAHSDFRGRFKPLFPRGEVCVFELQGIGRIFFFGEGKGFDFLSNFFSEKSWKSFFIRSYLKCSIAVKNNFKMLKFPNSQNKKPS